MKIHITVTKHNYRPYEGIATVAACYPDLPDPELSFIGTEDYVVDGQEMTRFRLSVTNRSAFPDALFTPAPHLPPCGLNTDSSRMWVRIYDDQDQYLYGFCALSTSEDLNSIWFAIPKGSIPPNAVYIELIDRECDTTYTSNAVNLDTTSKPDLIVTSLIVTSYSPTAIYYDYTIKNIGDAPADLYGQTQPDIHQVAVQGFLSQDTVFNNAGDIAAGGVVVTNPGGYLAPGESLSGSWSCGWNSPTVDPSVRPYLTLKVDWDSSGGDNLEEIDETNNTFATFIQ